MIDFISMIALVAVVLLIIITFIAIKLNGDLSDQKNANMILRDQMQELIDRHNREEGLLKASLETYTREYKDYKTRLNTILKTLDTNGFKIDESVCVIKKKKTNK